MRRPGHVAGAVSAWKTVEEPPRMWVKSRKVGPGKRQQRWDDGALTMHDREEQRRGRVQALLKQRVKQYRRVIAAVGKADGHGGASGKIEALAAPP